MTSAKAALPSYTTSGGNVGGSQSFSGGFMGAEVHTCGNAYHLFEEVDFMEATPQIHLHFLTSEKEYKKSGSGKIEIVCHGCGESLLLMYNSKGPDVNVRKSFEKKHLKCPNRGYEEDCPNYRSHLSVLDMRKKTNKNRVLHRRKD